MRSRAVKVRCDCLNRCGDDPWIEQGKAMPCKTMRAYLVRKKAIETREGRLLQAMKRAEGFISGFEGDAGEPLVPELLASLRGLIKELEVSA